jgi:hypothetical protein
LGTIVSDLKKDAEDVAKFLVKAGEDAPAVLQDAITVEGKLQPLLNAILPGSATAMALGNNLLDAAAQVVEDLGTDVAEAAAKAPTLDLTPFVNDLKAAIAAAKAVAAKA